MNNVDHPTFARFVAAELRGDATEGQLAHLHARPAEWYAELTAVYADINDQLSSRADEIDVKRLRAEELEEATMTEYIEARAEYQDWRRRALWTKKKVQRRMRQLSSLTRQTRERRALDWYAQQAEHALEAVVDNHQDRAVELLEQMTDVGRVYSDHIDPELREEGQL